MAIDISDVVNVQVSLQNAGIPRRDFGKTLLLHEVNSVVDSVDEALMVRSVRTYNSASSAQSDTSEVSEYANTYFAQQPADLVVGSVMTVGQPTIIYGDPTSPNAIQALGDVPFNFDGTIFRVDFASVSSYDDVVTVFNTSFSAAFNGATTSYDEASGRFIVTLPFNTDVDDGFEDTPQARALGLFGDTTQRIDRVAEVEDVTAALARITDVDCTPYWVALTTGLSSGDSLEQAVDWVGARPYQYAMIYDAWGTDVLVPGESTSEHALQGAKGFNNVAAMYNGRTVAEVDHKAISYIGLFSAVDFSLPDSVVTGKFKNLPGTLPTSLTVSERNELTRKRINYYGEVGSTLESITAEGTTFGTWIDSNYWLSWFRNAMEVSAYNSLRGSGRIPQTDPGLGVIRNAIASVCVEGVRNGGIAPGQLSAADTGAVQRVTSNPNFNGFLVAGYLIWAANLASQSDADRNARKSPPFTVFVKGAGAIHSIEILVNFEG